MPTTTLNDAEIQAPQSLDNIDESFYIDVPRTDKYLHGAHGAEVLPFLKPSELVIGESLYTTVLSAMDPQRV